MSETSATSASLYDIFNTFLTVLGALTSGVILGFTIVSYMVYDKDYKIEDEEDSTDEVDTDEVAGAVDTDEVDTDAVDTSEEEASAEEEEKYCFKFFDELENLPERELEKEELEELRLKTIEEETPEGKVIMSYNSDTESFWYYANSTTIPYSSLDAVARLYTVTYNCKSICVNYKEEWEKGKERVNKEKELDLKRREEEEHKPKPKSIFAKFKGYNKKQGADDEKKKYYIITERANKFKYKGKNSEFIKKEIQNSPLAIEPTTNGPLANEPTTNDNGPLANEPTTNSPLANEPTTIESNVIIEKKKIDYSTFKKIYIEKNY